MTILCQNDECGAPESRCKRGLQIKECSDFSGDPSNSQSDDSEATAFDGEAARLPWSGDALSRATLPLVFDLTRPHIIALVGLPDAGKTSLLTTVYDRVRRERLAGRDFAGSMTLRGWEVLNRNLKWRDGMPPTYPSRTSGARREPGFLHLALRADDSRLVDVLLADTPGQWFWTFARDENVPGAKIALDIADGLLLVVDPTSLVDERRHAMKQRLMGLARRIKEQVPEKPLALMLTRADKPVPQSGLEFREFVGLVETLYPGHHTYQTISAFESGRVQEAGKNVLESVATLLEILDAPPPVVPAMQSRERMLARFITADA